MQQKLFIGRLNAYVGKADSSKINNLNFYLRKLEKQLQFDSKAERSEK